MRVLLEIPVADYYSCLSRLPLSSPEYRILQNGVRERNDAGEDVIHVLCEEETAEKIRAVFATYCPEVLDRIKQMPANG